ncbi:short-chain dehydrogenase/reductase [Sphingobium lactosutens]|uniref:Short-chain dehydrogenase n=1 Tax=Sphingobium lactosutens DS20 TaxID=1331060 RepID=T0HI73_9SPHN|nr:short-chain dehydrogenase/reductase [Sphingobium lactosutens]EQB11813.1 hypothetical protein RLDS_22045 [Sphingobium lactosutens DS20]
MDLGLEGRVALVTGASQGIGAATAMQLAEAGCDIILAARSEGRLRRVADDIVARFGRKADIFAADLSSSKAVAALADRAGAVDILVNNAGAVPGGRLEDIGEDEWRAAWDLKVFGYINLTRLIYPQMASRGNGVIVNVIGAAAQIRNPTYICGVAGNAALTAFTMSIGSDSHRNGVRVVGVSPGPVATERLDNLGEAAVKQDAMPFGRAADPEEIASAIAFLASPRSGYTSGTVLMVDGGMSARAAG